MLCRIAKLVRLPVSLMVAVSAGFGYLLVRPSPDAGLGFACAGTFLLASACSILNQIQERDTDAMFSRTASRPLPSGQISPHSALVLSLAATAMAFGCFFLLEVPALPWMASLIVALYNGVYTPLKRRTGFALLVGAVPGAMPPVIGWAAAGGNLASLEILVVFGVYYLWQVPHFWLRVERDASEYVRAGLPIPVTCFGPEQYRLLLRLWFHAYVAGILLLPLFSQMQTAFMRIAVTLSAMLLCLISGLLFHRRRHETVFHWVNASLALVMCFLLTDRLYSVYGGV